MPSILQEIASEVRENLDFHLKSFVWEQPNVAPNRDSLVAGDQIAVTIGVRNRSNIVVRDLNVILHPISVAFIEADGVESYDPRSFQLNGIGPNDSGEIGPVTIRVKTAIAIPIFMVGGTVDTDLLLVHARGDADLSRVHFIDSGVIEHPIARVA